MLKIGLVGCGRIAKKHFEVFDSLKDKIQLVCVCDIIEEKAKEYSDKYNIPYYTDLNKMLNNEKIDILSICTPSGMHPKHGIAAAQKGIHVITEKPMAIELKGADNLISACDENGVKLFVVKQNRLNPGIKLLKNAILKKRFGKIFLANATVFWQRPQEYYDMADWRGTWALDGGSFMNQASHYIDLLVWLIGPVKYVNAETATFKRSIEAEDTGAAILRFKNDAIGIIQVTMLTYPKNIEGSITILGENGTVKIGGTAVNQIEKWNFDKYDDDDRLINNANYQPSNVYGIGHYEYYIDVISSIENNKAPLTDGRSGRKVLELILAIYEAAGTGKKVFLPLKKSKVIE